MTSRDYFDLDQILLGEEKVNISMEYYSKYLGFMKEKKTTDVKEGESITIPFYLASYLLSNELGSLNGFPHFLNKKVLKNLKAHNFRLNDDKYKYMNIKRISDYFFDLGITVTRLKDDENIDEEFKEQLEMAGKCLKEAFRKRYETLVVRAFCQNESEDCSPDEIYTSTELELFWSGRKPFKEFDKWEKYGFLHKRTPQKRNRFNIDDEPNSKKQKIE